ncbi:hypothetical protein L914_11110, partial [Phytophthora nicotianae]
EPPRPDDQNAHYNGWLHQVFVTGTLCFGADGLIVWSKHNYPGSWNDGDTSLGFRDYSLVSTGISSLGRSDKHHHLLVTLLSLFSILSQPLLVSISCFFQFPFASGLLGYQFFTSHAVSFLAFNSITDETFIPVLTAASIFFFGASICFFT